MFIQSDDVFSDETVGFVQEFADDELTERPDDLLTAPSIVTTVGFLMEVPGATKVLPTGQDMRPRPTTSRRPTSSCRRSTPRWKAQPHLPQRAQLAGGTGGRRAQIQDQLRPPQGITATPSAWPWSASACSTTSRPTGSCPPTWPSASWPCSSPSGCAAASCGRCSLVPVLIAVGTKRSWRGRSASLSLHDRRGRTLVVAAHRVHLADPAALHRGAAAARPAPATRRRAADRAAFIVSAMTAIAGARRLPSRRRCCATSTGRT